ncbi:MAG: hypothetical protein HY540_01800 [Deltaproteobacteria bacterium]|nr:hypothetical protein [Deltaproteobacteria bacterium]
MTFITTLPFVLGQSLPAAHLAQFGVAVGYGFPVSTPASSHFIPSTPTKLVPPFAHILADQDGSAREGWLRLDVARGYTCRGVNPAKHNEDAITMGKDVHGNPWFAVIDSPGGLPHGPDTSRIAAQAVARVMTSSRPDVSEAILAAHADIMASPYHRGGVAITLAHVIGNTTHIAHVGDTEARILRTAAAGKTTTAFRTPEHVEKAEDYTHTGIVFSFKKLITRIVGVNTNPPQVDVFTFILSPDDFLLLDSDGLYEIFFEDEFVADIDALRDEALRRMEQLFIVRSILAGEINLPGARIFEGRLVELPEAPGQFIDRDGNVYNDRGEKIGRLKVDNLSLIGMRYLSPTPVPRTSLFSHAPTLMERARAFFRERSEMHELKTILRQTNPDIAALNFLIWQLFEQKTQAEFNRVLTHRSPLIRKLAAQHALTALNPDNTASEMARLWGLQRPLIERDLRWKSERTSDALLNLGVYAARNHRPALTFLGQIASGAQFPHWRREAEQTLDQLDVFRGY